MDQYHEGRSRANSPPSTAVTAEELAGLRFFEGLPGWALGRLAGSATRGWFEQGAIVVRQNDEVRPAGAVCDYMRAVEVGREILGPLVSRTVLTGTSFAGGLAVTAQSVMQVADLLVVAVPSFGWAEGRRFLVEQDPGQEINTYLEAHPEREEDAMVVFSYFDQMNFAADIRCPTLVGLGLKDGVVPAPTVYAIANHLAGPREVVRLPVSHTEHPEERL